ncbi:MAG TPA: GH116 family glycosyl hydrolase [Armatimonadota bacterium]|nr:GH116 family glycosyl hydrolase [Armatimonadota bacterium]
MLRVYICIAMILFAGRAFAGLDVMNDFHGIQFNEVGRPVGMPMGGVGAGTIEITSQGTLAEFANVNNWAARIPSLAGTGLWVTYTVGMTTSMYSLAGDRVVFEGNFPFAKLRFPDLPFDLTLWCWSPFILHDLKHSSYPVAIFDAEIRNTGSKPADIGLVLSYGTGYGEWLQKLTAGGTEGLTVSISSTSQPYKGKSASGISFSTKSRFDSNVLEGRVRELKTTLEDAYLRSYDYAPVDIRPACNRSYMKSPFGSDAGNAPLNFGDLKPGKTEVYGIPFEIIDDAAVGGKSCIMAAAGADRITIPIGRMADCLFFLGNCAGWAAPAAGVNGEYTVKYKDGSTKAVSLRTGYEMTDWMGGSAIYSPAHLTGKGTNGTVYLINLFAIPTDPDKEIESVELSHNGAAAPLLFAVTAGMLSKTPLTEGMLAMRQVDVDRMAGSLESLKLASNADANYTIAARAIRGAKVFTYEESRPECLKPTIAGGSCPPPQPDQPEPKGMIYAVEQQFHLPPGKSAVAGLICSWYAPNHVAPNGHRFGHEYEKRFANSAEVAEEVARDHDSLLTTTKRHYDIIATSTLPKWFREMVQSNFYLLPACTWLTKDGIAFTYETPNGCPLFGTMDVRYYGSFTKLAAFPELDATVLRQFAGVQNADGFIPHDLGGTTGLVDNYRFPENATPTAPKGGRTNYQGYWVNLPIKYCLEVARHYWWTGDKELLREAWPHVKRAITWVNAQDEDNDGLPETDYGYDGWKMIDKCGYDANQWAAMLVAVARLADDLGEPEYAAQLRATHAKAIGAIEKYIWTGKYFRQSGAEGAPNLEWVSLLQLAGTWYSDILGIDDGLPNEQVLSAMKTMDAVLGNDAKYGLTDCLNPDGSRIHWWICDCEAVGWQYFYASHAMYRGLDDIALRVADEVWRGFTVENARIPWCQEEYIGDPPKGECTYWLLRDSRMGSTMVMSYAAAGLRMDIPAGSASISPANWIWEKGRFVLPALMPKWLGQIKFDSGPGGETYVLTNLDKPLELKSLRLRTNKTGNVRVTIAGKSRQAKVGADGTVDVGPITLGAKAAVIRIGQQ